MKRRTEAEMLETILQYAREDERVRAVALAGSRVMPDAKPDKYRDFDITFLVTDIHPFTEDREWIGKFGEMLILQTPDDWYSHPYDYGGREYFAYLMQFADGNRIDLHVVTLEYGIRNMRHDRLCMVLMDKDGVLPKIPEPTDEDHWVKRPTEAEYLCCCNEFWWMQNSVGKGLWRKEVTYAMDMLNLYIRPQLMKMLSWHVGVATDFSCSVGKSGKYFDKYLSKEEYGKLLATYPNSDRECIWQSVFVMCRLFDEAARKVGNGLGYRYREEEAQGSRKFLDCTYGLMEGAQDISMEQ